MKRIPVKHEVWLDYQDNVYLIKKDPTGNYVRFQINGTLCHQSGVTGFVIGQFKTKCKWFNPSWWYKKVAWWEPKFMFFDTKDEIGKDEIGKIDSYDELERRWNPKKRPAEKCLQSILKEASSKLGMKLKLDNENQEYGYRWCEAEVHVVDKNGTAYLLTWENCD